jgi:ribosomal protein L10
MADATAESSALERKQKYFAKLIKLLNEYPKIIIVSYSNVGSFSLQKIRKSLRDEAVLLMGKNTMIRMAIKSQLEQNPNLKELLPYIKDKIGFVFTKGDLNSVRKKILAEKVSAPAKVGAIAPSDVIIKAVHFIYSSSPHLSFSLFFYVVIFIFFINTSDNRYKLNIHSRAFVSLSPSLSLCCECVGPH